MVMEPYMVASETNQHKWVADLPTKEALKEVEEAAKREIVYDFDSPKLESWMIHEYRPIFKTPEV